MTHDLHTVNVGNNNIEILPHARHFESSSQTFFSVTFTRAECKNVHSKWKDLLRNKTFHSIIESNENKGGINHKDKMKRFVSEADIKVAPMDIVIANEVWVPFFKMSSHIFAMHVPPSLLQSNTTTDAKSSGMVHCIHKDKALSSDFPLLLSLRVSLD